MSYNLRDNWNLLTKELIQIVTNCNDDSDSFKHLEKQVSTQLLRADNLFYVSQKELDRTINSLCDKFLFHGFPRQAKELKRLYEKLTPEGLSKQERLNRLNVIKFLLSISESPTNNFHKFPQRFEKGDEEDIIDWPAYLKEGIPRWSPPICEDSSDDESDKAEELYSLIDDEDNADSKYNYQTSSETSDEYHDPFVNYRNSKINLQANVQSEWFNIEQVSFKPTSSDRDANIAFLWDDFIEETVKGLVPIQSSNVISEYKVMREVIWQLYEPHLSSCFHFNGDMFIPSQNITIASIRAKTFKTFMYEFIPYIESLQILRNFHESLVIKYDNKSVVPPDTYRSYDFAIQTIIQPIFISLKGIENKIKEQEITFTLLTLANEIRPLFQTVKILKDIHFRSVLDFKTNTPLKCASTLLWRLHKGLFYGSSKLEQDLYLTLYMHSLYKYFTIINSWLSLDVLADYTDEFVIADENPKDSHVLFNYSLISAKTPKQSLCCKSKVQEGEQDWQMEFSVKELDENTQADGIINIISTQVLQIGKNIHLLRLLGKLHLVPEFTGIHKETFYEVYVRKLLETIAKYFGVTYETDEVLENEPETEPSTPTFIFPVICPDECKYLTEMDKLENLVDTSNGFLVQAFESFFIKKPDTKLKNQETLFQKITKLTQSLFPVQQMIENVFVEILKERFSICGVMVKNVLIEDYSLGKQFAFLKNVYLFKDDMIFPLYRRIFHQLDADGLWGNHTWLTSYLQDVIMDAYPNFYEECSVEVKENWKLCTDSLKACNMISIQYKIRWPVNIIIRDEHMDMYKDLFQFILKFKWALYTLNHLYFTELEPKGKSAKDQHKSIKKLTSKLKTLRFGLINIISNIQHYILGYVFNKFSYKFEKAVEEAYDLESLLQAHTAFIQSLHKTCIDFEEYNNSSYGFYMLLYLVRKMKLMWRNLRSINDEELDKCEKFYWMCHEAIDPIINPTSYNSYVVDEL